MKSRVRRSTFDAKQMRPVAAALFLVIMVAFASTSAWAYDRDKSDVITLQNGSRILGDIISLEFGTLTLKTDNAGTLHIEWPAIRSVSSKYEFVIDKRGGAKFHGPVETATDAPDLLVGSGADAARIPMADVERMARYSVSFWNRINGNMSAGLTYAKAGDTMVGGANLNVYYRSTTVDSSLAFSANSTRTSSGDDGFRASLTSNVLFLRQSRNFWGLVGSLERDQELGINARLLGGAVLGRSVVQTSFSELIAVAGLVVDAESITGAAQQQTSLEGILGAYWRVFKFNDPETALTLGVSLYPSLTESSRYRGSANLSLTHKIAGDFTLGLSGYWSADTHPPDPTAEKSDYGLTFNVGYSFGE